MSKRIINFRSFYIVAIAVFCAVMCVYAYTAINAVGIALGCIGLCVFSALSAVFIVRFITSRVRLYVVLTFCLATILFLCALVIGIVTFDNRVADSENNGYRNVTGRVCAIDTSSGKYLVDIDGITIDGNDAEGIMRIYVAVSDNNIAELVGLGDRLSFGANITAVDFVRNGNVNGSSYRTGIRYKTHVESNDVVISAFGEPSGIEAFLHSYRTLLVKNMGEKYGNIAFSMITGDKHSLDNEIHDYFSAAGLGHIMAVSGLHIGFFVLLLNFLLAGLSKKMRYPIIATVLIAYTVVADFSPSVIRAVIMTMISGMGILIGGRRDLLSSLLCAFSFILAFKPFYLFEAGFVMSFGAIFGIAMYSNQIKRFMNKRKIPNKLSGMASGSVSVSLGLLPAEAGFFGKIQWLACVVNMIAIPYISIVFISILCFSAIAAVPGCGAILKFCEYLMIPLDNMAYAIAQVPLARTTIPSVPIVMICYPIMFFASEYIMLGKCKTVAIVYSVVIGMLIFSVCALF